LRPVQKILVLREFANQGLAEKADYIEYLYSDEDGHRKEIEDLWEKRRKRLSHYKTATIRRSFVNIFLPCDNFIHNGLLLTGCPT